MYSNATFVRRAGKTNESLAWPILSRRSVERPIFWIVAGPNGSGKSSLYDDANIEAFGHSVWIINPDALAARIVECEGLGLSDANLEAVRRIEDWLDTSIDAYQTVGVETVLSTDKYRRLVEAAKRRSFEIRLIYVILDSPDRNIERVRLRVLKGGHDVPEAKIRSRYERSLKQLPWFLSQAESAWLFDNPGTRPKRIGEKRGGTIRLDSDALPSIMDAVRLSAVDHRQSRQVD